MIGEKLQIAFEQWRFDNIIMHEKAFSLLANRLYTLKTLYLNAFSESLFGGFKSKLK